MCKIKNREWVMKHFQGTIIAVIGALGLIGAGYFIGKSLQRFGGSNNVVTVRGIGQKDIKANYGSWQIEFFVSEPTLEGAMKSFKKSNQTIKDFLHSHGFREDEISLGVPNVRFATEQNKEVASKKVNVEGVVYVASEEVEKMQTAFGNMAALFDRGIILNGWNQFPVYSIKNFDALRPQLLEEATKSALAVAQKFSEAAEVKLGKVKNLNQGAFSITSKEEGTEENMGASRKPSSYNKVVRVVVHVTYGLD